LILAATLAAGGAAQAPTPAPDATPDTAPATPDLRADRRPARAPRTDRKARLDALFEVLRRAPDAEIAKAVEQRIEATLLQSGSDTADLLMVRANAAIQAKENELALELLDAVITFEPNYTEAWARRASLHFARKDIANSLADLRVVIAREPRHFTALTGLGVIFQDLGEDKRALEAFRRAMEVHPHLKAIPDLIKKLTDKVEGRDI
jgi:tetratricopeptide (TPR) repeat protein